MQSVNFTSRRCFSLSLVCLTNVSLFFKHLLRQLVELLLLLWWLFYLFFGFHARASRKFTHNFVLLCTSLFGCWTRRFAISATMTCGEGEKNSTTFLPLPQKQLWGERAFTTKYLFWRNWTEKNFPAEGRFLTVATPLAVSSIALYSIFCAHRSRVLWPKRRWSNVREKRVFLILKDFLRESWVFLVWKSSHNKNKRKWERKIQQIVMIILLLFSH